MSRMTDAVEDAIWRDVDKHENGCWTWTGPNICKIIPVLAELVGNPVPAGRKMYRMPDCILGAACVNPAHCGTSEDYMLHVRLNRNAVGEFTEDDLNFLAELGISSEW